MGIPLLSHEVRRWGRMSKIQRENPMSEKWSKEFDSCFQVGSIEEIADALEKRSGSEENALAMLAMTAFTLMTRRGICEMQNVAPDGKGIRLELIGFRGNETIPDTLH